MTGTILKVDNLRVRFDRGGHRVHAVNGLSYQLQAGRTLALIGESGSGKTVSSRALMGLLPGTAAVTGSATIDGVELVGMPEEEMRRHRGKDIAMVFQDPTRSLNPTMRIGSQITEAIRAHNTATNSGAASRRAAELLSLVRIPDPRRRFHEYPHQLSGGMRQRVMIAIALAADPKVLIADEATTALDVTTQAQIMDLLADLRSRLGTAIILISHDLGLAASYADEVIVMYAGRAVEYAPARILFGQMRMPYTRALLDAIPRLERASHSPLPVTPGQPPDLTALPAGCSFEPRCPRAEPVCAQSRPPFVEHEGGHWWACWNPCRNGDLR
ncbi:MAG TPA: ABC transporter ATP-binding protein [Rugosimonospora sp.]|nr:ABC transporter ATP-binding protein [Rugosimonospora sp.]